MKPWVKCILDFYKQSKLYDYVVTVCDESQSEHCPIFPGVAQKLHWGFPDLSAFAGSDEEKLRKTKAVREQREAKVKDWLKAYFSRSS